MGINSTPELGGCKPAALILNKHVGEMDCAMCPFPFCVMAEAKAIRTELNRQLILSMRQLGTTIEMAAQSLGMTSRTAFRYVSDMVDKDCEQCCLLRSSKVICVSNLYTVLRNDQYMQYNQYTVVLNRHGPVAPQELKGVECFIDYVFPSGHIAENVGSHYYWQVDRVEPEDGKNFERMCDNLREYTMSTLSTRGVKSKVQ